MTKLIISIAAITIILSLLLVSFLWYKHCILSVQDDIIYVMRISRNRLLIGISGIIFFSAMDVLSFFLDDQMIQGFLFFYFFVLISVYLCIVVLLWRGIIRADSITFYTPLLPKKEIKFYEIDYVHYTDNNTYGLGGQKSLVGYHGQKKLFSIEEDISGFSFLCALLYERKKIKYTPVIENSTSEEIMTHIPVLENFSVTPKKTDKIRAVVCFLLITPWSIYAIWDRTEFELIYQLIAVVAMLISFPILFSNLLWKATIDFHNISIRNSLGIVKNYEMRQITKVVELEHYIILYIGQKKIAKIAKDNKNFQYLFERLLRTEAEINRKY